MKIKFQADADLNQIILRALIRQEPAINFKTAMSANLAYRSDDEVLAVSSNEGRVLVSHDHKTLPQCFAAFIESAHSSGVIIIPQYLKVSAVVEDLLLIWSVTEAEEWINRICFLPI